jgi:O-antigen ligase
MSVVWYNLLLADDNAPDLLLKAVAVTTVIIALWVVKDSIASGGNIAAAGPFRNRAHAGIYMHSAFWLVLAGANWPRARGYQQLLTYVAAILVLYIVATAGRRSVYFALALGLTGLAAGMSFADWKTRRRVLTLLGVTAVSLGIVYFVLADFWEPAAFFKTRITMVDERLEAFTTTSVDETEVDFIVLQRQGALRGFFENPILGIGYGGFAESEYSPTGHEVHSTPLRFLVELGLVGITLYVWFVLEAVATAFRAWRNSLGGPYATAALILLVGILALSVSYTYNRQMTERVFWLYFAFLMVVETRLRPIPPSQTPQQVPQPQAPKQIPLSRMPPQVPRRRQLPPAYRARLDD